jgi:hypothetical protein
MVKVADRMGTKVNIEDAGSWQSGVNWNGEEADRGNWTHVNMKGGGSWLGGLKKDKQFWNMVGGVELNKG